MVAGCSSSVTNDLRVPTFSLGERKARTNEAESCLLERQNRSSLRKGSWERMRPDGWELGFARTFTCLDHRTSTMASAKQPVVTRDQIKDTTLLYFL